MTIHQKDRAARLPGFYVALGASLAALTLGAPQALAKSSRSGVTARTFSLTENGTLALTSRKGFTLNERGSASGTIGGTIYVHLTIVSTNRVTAQVNIYAKGGSITGYGTASYHKGRTSANFVGSLSVSGGSGSYAHAHGSGLSFSGTIQRSNDAITVHVNGKASA